MNAAAKANLSYEEAYKRLEEAVGELSAGGLSLEEALGRFEQGIALANYCSTLLDRAELRVQQVGQLAPEDLSALIDGDSPAEPGGRGGPGAGSAGGASGPASRRADAGPATGYPLGGGAGSGGRRGLPPTTGPQRKSGSDEPLDPLFDDI